MARLLYDVNLSLDGFIAGKGRGQQAGAKRLAAWKQELAVFRKSFPHMGLEGGVTNASTALLEEEDTTGAMIFGRRFFGGGPGPWGDPPWNGPWGGNPFNVPVFVLTHHAREPFVPDGQPPFTFVTEGISAALEMAKRAAAGKDVMLGGASTANQYLVAGLLDQIDIHLVPVFLGEGLRLFADPALSGITLEQVRVIEAPGVTHLRYRVVRK